MDVTSNGIPKQAKQRKPRPKPERRIKILENPTVDTDGWAAVEIRIKQGKKEQVEVYLCRFIPTQFGPDALGYEIEKLDSDLRIVENYHVLLAGKETSCTCPGGTYCGHCKHSEGLAALRAKGLLEPHRSTSAFAKNDPDGYAEHMWSITEGEYPDEPATIPFHADFDPREEDIIDPDPAA